jgi:hypothetical protein
MSYIGKQPIRTALTSSDIEDGIITAAKIEDGAVVAAEIASNAVTTAKINADAVTAAKIADDVINSEHIAADSIDAEHYAAGSVDTTALGADAVTGAKIADDAINSEHYTDGSIDTAHLADGQVTTAKLATAVFTGATDIGADIADADLFLMDDGAGGTIRKTAASRIKTYAGGLTGVTTDSGNVTITDGNLTFGGAGHGVHLGVTSAAAGNLLNDYEEGTFTPTWTSNVTVSVASGNYGYYTKIGDIVTVHFGAVLNASSPSYYAISNAPFQSNIASGTAIGSGREYGQTGNAHVTYIGDNSTTITAKQYNNVGVSNPYFSGSITYRTD